jgi:predicted ATP-dependent endonuclease of OLD family
MKIKKLKIKNFRSYNDEITIEFNDLTAFVGKNDIGKSTILEALDVFFNEGKGSVKLDKDDINKKSFKDGDNEIIITVCFEDLPSSIVIDSSNETNLESEYLLNSDYQLEIIKKYHNAGTAKVFVKAKHPSNQACDNLLQKKNNELKDIIKKNNISCSNKDTNAPMRLAIWNHFINDLNLKEVEIDVTKNDAKSIWDNLQNYLPLYSLFQSDRKNHDGDSEIQDPLKEATKQILNDKELIKKFNEIAIEVENRLKEVSNRTLEKLREMNPDIASGLNPVIPTAESLKWADVFKGVSISSDDDIPINKRGLGVRRIILLSFFRAEVDRRKKERNSPNVIYAFEEPESSQHTDHQKKLIKAFLDLVKTPNTQIIITTHSAQLVKELKFEHLRLISFNGSSKTINSVLPHHLPYPSLNEVNYLAFGEVTEEYHNELYGFINDSYFNEFKIGKKTFAYKKIKKDGTEKSDQLILSEYIRHQIHYPENTKNQKYTFEQISDSIKEMRQFIDNQNKPQTLKTHDQNQ